MPAAERGAAQRPDQGRPSWSFRCRDRRAGIRAVQLASASTPRMLSRAGGDAPWTHRPSREKGASRPTASPPPHARGLSEDGQRKLARLSESATIPLRFICSQIASRSAPRRPSPRLFGWPRPPATRRSRPAHVLAALLADTDGIALSLLRKLGADADAIRARAGGDARRAAGARGRRAPRRRRSPPSSPPC